MSVLTPAQIIALWLDQGGSLSSAASALAHALAESGGSATVASPNPDGGTNVGLYQLDTQGVGEGFTVAALQDPYWNTKLTVQHSDNGQDWGPWPDQWQDFTVQAQQAVSAYQSAAGSGSQATAYMNSQLKGVPGAIGPGKSPPPVQYPAGYTPPGSSSSASSGSSGSSSGSSAGAAQSLLGQAGSVISDANDLISGAADVLNWFWQWFQPGQGWRLACGAAAAVLGYLGLRQWGLIPPVTSAARAVP